MPAQPYVRQPVSVEIDEKIYDGFFLMRAKMVTVWHADRSKGAHLLGSSEPEVLARLLLTDLVREELDK